MTPCAALRRVADWLARRVLWRPVNWSGPLTRPFDADPEPVTRWPEAPPSPDRPGREFGLEEEGYSTVSWLIVGVILLVPALLLLEAIVN